MWRVKTRARAVAAAEVAAAEVAAAEAEVAAEAAAEAAAAARVKTPEAARPRVAAEGCPLWSAPSLDAEAAAAEAPAPAAAAEAAAAEAVAQAETQTEAESSNAELQTDEAVLLAWRTECPELRTLWDESAPVTAWEGVKFGEAGDADAGRVVMISIQVKGLTGDLPAALGGLTALTGLYLGGNELTSVPAAGAYTRPLFSST